MRAKLLEIKRELQRRMHQPIPEPGKWLKQVVAGYFLYFAVPTNIRALKVFRYEVIRRWRQALRRRSRKARMIWTRMTWTRIAMLADCFPGRVSFILGPTSDSPSPTRGRSRMRESCTSGSVRGARSNPRPYRDRRARRSRDRRRANHLRRPVGTAYCS